MQPKLRFFDAYSNDGHQIVRVEHVHVNDSGQAVIGNAKKPDTQG